jgi:hypothetical protein
MSSDVQIKNQIKSLKLSKKNQFNAVTHFFSFVSLNELTELQALTLIDLDTETADRISSTLPLLNKLKCFRIAKSSFISGSVLTSLPTSTIQTLSLQDLPPTHPFMSLVNLTVSSCSVEDLCVFFTYSPMLQYLRIEHTRRYSSLFANNQRSTDDHALHLKRLVINNFEGEFNSLETFLKRTPNLKSLMISSNGAKELVDACRWQHLITTALPLLNVFKFKFDIKLENENNSIVDKFYQFQTDFWHQQHHWYTEYVLNKDEGHIYTVPYISNEYEITQYTKRHCNELSNNMKTFANVTDLTLSLDVINEVGEYYFSNVKSLRLANGDIFNDSFEETKDIQYLKRIVNLCSITHLELSSECRWNSPSVMLQLLKEALHLSSLKIDKKNLMKMFDNHELCNYLTKMIKKLDISTSGFNNDTIDYSETKKLCQIFSNLEEFQCDVGRSDNLEIILNELSKLLHITMFSYRTPYTESGYDWLEKHKSELDLYIFFVESECTFVDYSYINGCCYHGNYGCCDFGCRGYFGYNIHGCCINSHIW